MVLLWIFLKEGLRLIAFHMDIWFPQSSWFKGTCLNGQLFETVWHVKCEILLGMTNAFIGLCYSSSTSCLIMTGVVLKLSLTSISSRSSLCLWVLEWYVSFHVLFMIHIFPHVCYEKIYLDALMTLRSWKILATQNWWDVTAEWCFTWTTRVWRDCYTLRPYGENIDRHKNIWEAQ